MLLKGFVQILQCNVTALSFLATQTLSSNKTSDIPMNWNNQISQSGVQVVRALNRVLFEENLIHKSRNFIQRPLADHRHFGIGGRVAGDDQHEGTFVFGSLQHLAQKGHG